VLGRKNKMEFKVNIGDNKTGKTLKKVYAEADTKPFIGKKIGDKMAGKDIGFDGYEFQVAGGSDYCGFPMRKDVDGTKRRRILTVGGVGVRKNIRGRKIRKNMAGNTIFERTAQINLKILKYGKAPLFEEEKPAEEAAPENKEEAPKEEKADKKE
jgi:small subunit ribosomal protein S6e